MIELKNVGRSSETGHSKIFEANAEFGTKAIELRDGWLSRDTEQFISAGQTGVRA
jgi:hypothetical protein